MTANKRVTGADNEQRATEYLIDNGYSILERNFRNKTGEIDIIAQNDNLIVFVEIQKQQKIRLCSRSCQLQKAADNTTGCNVLSYNKIQKL